MTVPLPDYGADLLVVLGWIRPGLQQNLYPYTVLVIDF